MKIIKHLLVIRLSAMGDVAMTVPVLKEFHDKYPEIQVTVLTKGFFAPIFSQIPNVNVHIAEVKGKHKGVFGLSRLYRELKIRKIDAVIDLHDVLRSNILKLFFKVGGVQFVQLDKGRKEKKALVSGYKNPLKPLRTTHERYCDAFATLDFQLKLRKTSVLERLPFQDDILVQQAIEKRAAIGIAPFAAFEGKMYPVQLMEQVIAGLDAAEKYAILLFGGGKTELKQLSNWEKKYKNTVNVSKRLSFAKELQLISNLDLMLAMDSGNGHLSAMYGVPTITLWGVTHPYAGFAPYGQPEENSILADRNNYPLIPTSIYGNKWPEGYEKAMETIHPEEILEKITELLQ